MHFVQLFLEIFHLLFDGGFPVELFVVLLLGGLGGALDVDHLQPLPQRLFQGVEAVGEAVLLQQGVSFFRGKTEPGGQGRRHGPHAVPVGGKAPQEAFPLLPPGEGEDLFLDLLRTAPGLRRIQLPEIRPSGQAQAEAAVRQLHDIRHVDPVLQRYGQESVSVHFRDNAGDGDGIKASGGQIAAAFVLPLHQQGHPLLRNRLLSGQQGIILFPEPHPGAGQGKHVI